MIASTTKFNTPTQNNSIILYIVFEIHKIYWTWDTSNDQGPHVLKLLIGGANLTSCERRNLRNLIHVNFNFFN